MHAFAMAFAIKLSLRALIVMLLFKVREVLFVRTIIIWLLIVGGGDSFLRLL